MGKRGLKLPMENVGASFGQLVTGGWCSLHLVVTSILATFQVGTILCLSCKHSSVALNCQWQHQRCHTRVARKFAKSCCLQMCRHGLCHASSLVIGVWNLEAKLVLPIFKECVASLQMSPPKDHVDILKTRNHDIRPFWASQSYSDPIPDCSTHQKFKWHYHFLNCRNRSLKFLIDLLAGCRGGFSQCRVETNRSAEERTWEETTRSTEDHCSCWQHRTTVSIHSLPITFAMQSLPCIQCTADGCECVSWLILTDWFVKDVTNSKEDISEEKDCVNSPSFSSATSSRRNCACSFVCADVKTCPVLDFPVCLLRLLKLRTKVSKSQADYLSVASRLHWYQTLLVGCVHDWLFLVVPAVENATVCWSEEIESDRGSSGRIWHWWVGDVFVRLFGDSTYWVAVWCGKCLT